MNPQALNRRPDTGPIPVTCHSNTQFRTGSRYKQVPDFIRTIFLGSRQNREAIVRDDMRHHKPFRVLGQKFPDGRNQSWLPAFTLFTKRMSIVQSNPTTAGLCMPLQLGPQLIACMKRVDEEQIAWDWLQRKRAGSNELECR